MLCPQCGKENSESAEACRNCGAEPARQQSTLRVKADGTLHWVYELNFWKNPTILFTVWKVVLLAGLFPALLMFVLTLGEGFGPAVLLFGKVYGLIAGIFTALLLLAYPILALIYGGKYCVVFEMNHKGLHHTQMQKQFKKAQVLGLLAVLGGAAAGNPAVSGAGILAGSKQSMTTQFSKVNTIVIREKRQAIHLNEGLARNQVYADGTDFEIVRDHILAHCKEARIIWK
jgi:ribosomal protein L40E